MRRFTGRSASGRKANDYGITSMDYQLFTSESVSEGHPDKVADQVSDAVLDAMLAQDPDSRVACETLIKTGIIVVAGEIRTNANVDVDKLVRQVVNDIGYDSHEVGFDATDCTVVNALGMQSSDIAMGVDETNDHEQGAGDQGLMFGYATNETDVLMPAPITYSHRLVKQQAQARRSSLPFLRPDAKSQLSFRYDEAGRPVGIEALVLSTQHAPDISQADLREAVMEEVVKPVVPGELAFPGHQDLHQSNRPVHHRRAGRRLRSDGSKDHR